MQKVRYHTFNVLYLLVSKGFQILFHSPSGVLFTFPSRYSSTIGHQVVFSLTGWSPLIHTGFLVSCLTLDVTRVSLLFRVRDSSPSLICFSKTFPLQLILHFVVTPNPD